jgi:hypothetical protein
MDRSRGHRAGNRFGRHLDHCALHNAQVFEIQERFPGGRLEPINFKVRKLRLSSIQSCSALTTAASRRGHDSASSNEGNLVLDPFCGCGTTAVSGSREFCSCPRKSSARGFPNRPFRMSPRRSRPLTPSICANPRASNIASKRNNQSRPRDCRGRDPEARSHSCA